MKRYALSLLIVLLGAFGSSLVPPPALAQSASPELELARKYAPIARVKQQHEPCDTTGEPYLPVPVEIAFNDPEVLLKRHRTGDELRDPVVVAAPVAQDLAGLDGTYYLDLPGNPRLPGCGYEHWSRTRMAELGLKPTVYARVVTEEGRPGTLVLQYWFYWAFDDFNNTHESDWEMIQFHFAADTAEQALSQEPVEVVFAQHAGGERAEWDDDKVERDGDRPIVYPAAGSHATYYGDAIWIGWGDSGTGFGCDITSAPLDDVSLEVVLLPNDPDPEGPFAWLLFEGRWGERQPWEFNGPLSPAAGDKWLTPLSWTDDVRSSSLAISNHQTLGPGPATLFCAISGFAGSAATSFSVSPLLIAWQAAAAILALLILTAWNWQFIARAIRLYTRHAALFLPLSLLLLVVAFAGGWVQGLIGRQAIAGWIGRFVSGDTLTAMLGLGFSSLAQFLLLAVVAPVIIHATNSVLHGDDAAFRDTWQDPLRKVPETIGATLLNAVILTLLALTLLLIPLAIYRAVQWLYTPHAVTIDNASIRTARHVSREKMCGRWWRTLAMSALIWLVAGIPGPVIANLLLFLGIVSLEGAEVVSSLIYAITFTITIIATTLYYLRLGDREPLAEAPDPAQAGPTSRHRDQSPEAAGAPPLATAP